jgi:hypothetical protein
MFYHLLPYCEQGPLYQSTVCPVAFTGPPPALPPATAFAIYPGDATSVGLPASIFGFPSPLPPFSQTGVPGYKVAVKLFQCPADPTVPSNGLYTPTPTGFAGDSMAVASYAGNIQIFCKCHTENQMVIGSYSPPVTDPYGPQNFIDPAGEPRMNATFPDGTSNTILWAEKYAHCVGPVTQALGGLFPGMADGGNFWAYNNLDSPPNPSVWFGPYHPGFSLAFWESFPGVPPTIGPNSVFQLQPLEQNCNPLLASTGHTGGMVVCMADASGRVVSSNVSGITWWALCTPAGGEVMLDDWR